jgi:hypothetical protein
MKNGVKVGGSQEQTAEYMLTYIANSIWQRGYQPSIRELCKHMGWSSFNYATHLLKCYFENHGNRGKGYVGARAVSFNWRKYVTDPSFPRDECKIPAAYLSGRDKTTRHKRRKLGRVRVKA